MRRLKEDLPRTRCTQRSRIQRCPAQHRSWLLSGSGDIQSDLRSSSIFSTYSPSSVTPTSYGFRLDAQFSDGLRNLSNDMPLGRDLLFAQSTRLQPVTDFASVFDLRLARLCKCCDCVVLQKPQKARHCPDSHAYITGHAR